MADAVPLLWAAAAACLALLLGSTLRRRANQGARPVRPDPPTMDLRDEPAGVAGVLVDRGRVSPDALAGTLFDLAAKDLIEVFQVTPEDVRIRLRRRRETTLLTEHEVLVVVALEQAGGGAEVPLDALVDELVDMGSFLWHQYAQLVLVDAFERGLFQEDPTQKIGCVAGPVLSAAVGGLVGVALGASATENATVSAVVLGLLGTATGAVVLGVPAFLFAHVGRGALALTDEGRAATAHWLGVRDFLGDDRGFAHLPPAAVELWDRYLAVGCASGVAPTAAEAVVDGLRRRLVSESVRVLRGKHRTTTAGDFLGHFLPYDVAILWGLAADERAYLGPEDGAFWDHVGAVVWGYRALMKGLHADPPAAHAVIRRRLALLRETAPPAHRQDVEAMAGAVEPILGRLEQGDTTIEEALASAQALVPDLEGPATRLREGLARHHGCEPDGPALLAELRAHFRAELGHPAPHRPGAKDAPADDGRRSQR